MVTWIFIEEKYLKKYRNNKTIFKRINNGKFEINFFKNNYTRILDHPSKQPVPQCLFRALTSKYFLTDKPIKGLPTIQLTPTHVTNTRL